MTIPYQVHSFWLVKLLKWKVFLSECPACCHVNFIANAKVPLGIPAETAAALCRMGLSCASHSEPADLQLSGAWMSPSSWTGLLFPGFVPLSPPLAFHWHGPAQLSWLSFLSSELHPCLLFYCRLKAWVACGGYQLINKLQSSCPVINLSYRSKMKHVDLFSFKW